MKVLGQFWVREHGLTLKINRLRALEDLSLGEQLFAAILRSDAGLASTLLATSSSDQRTAERLMALVTETGFGSLVLDRLCELELLNLLDASDRITLKKIAAEQAARQILLDNTFAALLRLLAPIKTGLVWIKGASLSRTVYTNAQDRQYCDLDLVVHPTRIQAVLDLLERAGFRTVVDPGFSNQLGVGPVRSHRDYFLAPDSEWIPVSALSLQRDNDQIIDVKVSPLERGIQLLELDRFFADSTARLCQGQQYLAPSLIDHLLICLYNLYKDRFINWKTLFDIDLLAAKLSETPSLWITFVQRCKRESVELCAWSGLLLAINRFNTSVPELVLEQLSPFHIIWHRVTGFTVSPFFVWNATSLPMLVFNAVTSTDRNRKFSLLSRSVCPPADFLSQYYNHGCQLTPVTFVVSLFLHWLVLLLPGGLVRRTLGSRLWPTNYTSAGGANTLASVNLDDSDQHET